jgi:small neutral amino acid transporter SnatA (MarC family)
LLENFVTAFLYVSWSLTRSAIRRFFWLSQRICQNAKKILTAVEVSIVAAAVMLFFALCGAWILYYLAVSFSAVKIAGGIILLLVAIQALAVIDPAFFENFKNATLCDHAHHLCLPVPVITD